MDAALDRAADPAVLDMAFPSLPEPEQMALPKRAFTALAKSDQKGPLEVALKALSGAERRALLATILEPLPVPDWCFIAELVFMAVRQQAPKEGRRTS
jgi:hypothetical protein